MEIKLLKNLFIVIITVIIVSLFVSCGTGFSSSDFDSGSSSGGTSGYIYVSLYHPGKSGYTILSKKAVIGGKTISSNGKGSSSQTKVSVSGKCSYTTYESYEKNGTSTYNKRTGGGTYTFNNGKKYTINCASGSVSQN